MIKYLKIYLWQGVSLIFNFAALFVVTPYLSSNPALFGIYSIITAAYLFLSYADLGFLGAGMKYASECYAKNDKEGEVKIIGFVGFIFLIFVLLYGLVMGGMAINPGILVKSLKTEQEFTIARELLIILALFCPVFVLQRVLQIIFGVRLEDYRFQKLLIISNAVKILSAFVFFGGGRYAIVGYFLFSQLCTVMAAALGCFMLKKRANYDLVLLLKSFKFSKPLYYKTKKLAFSSLFLTLCWILYYEMDPFVIGKTLGPAQVAIYAVGLTIVSYFRSLFGIMFTPFVARYNYFIGLNDHEGLKNFFIRVLIISLPLMVFPVLSVSVTVKVFVFNLVGDSYTQSVGIAQALVLGYIFSFISYPAGIIIMAYERVKELYLTSAILPVVYWLGIITTFGLWGLPSFAYFKFVAFALSAIIYIVILSRLLHIDLLTLAKKVLLPAVIPGAFIVAVLLFIRGYLPLDKSKLNLLLYVGVNGIVVAVGVVLYYFTSTVFRKNVNDILGSLRSKIGFLSRKTQTG